MFNKNYLFCVKKISVVFEKNGVLKRKNCAFIINIATLIGKICKTYKMLSIKR